MGLSVSGFVNGLDVPTIVSQLMASESIPQQQLQSQLATVQTQASAYRAVNSKFQALLTAAQAMTSSATWSATTASSSASSVAVSSTSTAQPGSVTFAVTSVATAEQQISTGSGWTDSSASFGSSSIAFTSGGTTTNIAVGGNGTLADAVSAINSSGLGVTASLVQTNASTYQLQVTSNTTGTASAFSLGSGFGEVNAATDATLKVGTGTAAYNVTSSTNTFSSVMPGVTFTVSQKESAVTLSVASDPQSVGDKMKAFVDAANAALSEISTDTASGMSSTGTSTGNAGPLAGDYNVQNLATQLRKAVSDAVGSLGSPAQAGVQLNSDGTIAFKEDTFINAVKSNPSLAQQLVNGSSSVPGIAARVATLATDATDSVSGTLVTLANGDDAQAKTLQSQINDWTVRLSQMQTSLTTQYSSLQTALSTLQNQQSWLSNLFGTGSSSSSSSKSS